MKIEGLPQAVTSKRPLQKMSTELIVVINACGALQVRSGEEESLADLLVGWSRVWFAP